MKSLFHTLTAERVPPNTPNKPSSRMVSATICATPCRNIPIWPTAASAGSSVRPLQVHMNCLRMPERSGRHRVVGRDKRFLCGHAAGNRIHSTFYQQYGDVVFVVSPRRRTARDYADQVKKLALSREGPKCHADDALRKDLDVMNPDATINRRGDGKQRRQQQSRTR